MVSRASCSSVVSCCTCWLFSLLDRRDAIVDSLSSRASWRPSVLCRSCDVRFSAVWSSWVRDSSSERFSSNSSSWLCFIIYHTGNFLPYFIFLLYLFIHRIYLTSVTPLAKSFLNRALDYFNNFASKLYCFNNAGMPYLTIIA